MQKKTYSTTNCLINKQIIHINQLFIVYQKHDQYDFFLKTNSPKANSKDFIGHVNQSANCLHNAERNTHP